MYANLKNCIGKNIEKLFLEWFYLNNSPVSIIRLYVKFDSYFDITSCEENVFIREQKEFPHNEICGEFVYKPIEQKIKWLYKCRVVSIKYLIDSNNIKRGILFIFEQDHNFAFYNKGYEFDDDNKFELDINLGTALHYKTTDF
jgi:alanine-alpha-ketoisovalerate/valine-pyruvate aminotransferase